MKWNDENNLGFNKCWRWKGKTFYVSNTAHIINLFDHIVLIITKANLMIIRNYH